MDNERKGRMMKKTSLGTVLGQTIGTALDKYDTVKIGDKFSVKLDQGRHVSIGFGCSGVRGEWTNIELCLVSKEHGLLETQRIPFNEVFDSMADVSHPNKLRKRVWEYQGNHAWYGKPTPQDLKALRLQIKDYLNLVE